MEMFFKKTNVSECDRWIGFVDDSSCGKKNDHVAHNAFLNHIMDYYSDHASINTHHLKCRVIHNNDCGAQHECLKNFLKLTKNSDTHKCTYAQKFAQKYGFKGEWDGTSKLIKNTITRLELKLTRVANAKDFYYH